MIPGCARGGLSGPSKQTEFQYEYNVLMSEWKRQWRVEFMAINNAIKDAQAKGLPVSSVSVPSSVTINVGGQNFVLDVVVQPSGIATVGPDDWEVSQIIKRLANERTGEGEKFVLSEEELARAREQREGFATYNPWPSPDWFPDVKKWAKFAGYATVGVIGLFVLNTVLPR